MRVVLSPKDGYRFDLDETTLVTVNGSLASVNSILEDGDISIVFFAKATEAEEPDKPMSLARIIIIRQCFGRLMKESQQE